MEFNICCAIIIILIIICLYRWYYTENYIGNDWHNYSMHNNTSSVVSDYQLSGAESWQDAHGCKKTYKGYDNQYGVGNMMYLPGRNG